MKRPGDMKRRRQAAYRRAWTDAMEIVLDRIDGMARSGDLPAAVAHELRTVCNRPPPDLSEAEPTRRTSTCRR